MMTEKAPRMASEPEISETGLRFIRDEILKLMVASIATAKAEIELSNQARLHSIAMLNAELESRRRLSGQLADGELSDFAWDALKTPAQTVDGFAAKLVVFGWERRALGNDSNASGEKIFQDHGPAARHAIAVATDLADLVELAAATGSAPESRGNALRPLGEIVERVGAELERTREQALAARGGWRS